MRLTPGPVSRVARPRPRAHADCADCVEFQQAVLGEQLIFIAGISKIKSKGRGEECISQNIRLCKNPSGRKTLMYFANSQRGDGKRYVSIPRRSSAPPFALAFGANCSLEYAIDELERGKPSACRVTLRLRPHTDLLAQMKHLQIDFLDIHGECPPMPSPVPS